MKKTQDKNQLAVTDEKALAPVVEKANALTIANEDDMREATELLSRVNKSLDAATEEKEKVTKPLNEALKAERGRWKGFETMCETAIKTIRDKMGAYQTKKMADAKAEEDRIAARVKEGKGNLKPETAVKKMEEIDRPVGVVSSDAGMVKFKTVKMFAVEDISALPIEFVVANDVAIRKAMNEGREIPGVKYWTEQRPDNYR